jgi:hypothetical protein
MRLCMRLCFNTALLLFALSLTVSIWAAKASPTEGSAAWVSCEAGFSVSKTKFISDLHPMILKYLDNAWVDLKFGNNFVTLNRNDAKVKDIYAYRSLSPSDMYQNVSTELRDKVGVTTMLSLADRINEVGLIWEGPIEGYPQQTKVIMTEVYVPSWPLQIKSVAQDKKKDGTFDGASMDLLASPSKKFSEEYPTIMSQIFHSDKSEVESWESKDRFHGNSVAFLAENPVIVTKITTGLVAREAVKKASDENWIEPRIPLQSLYAGVDDAFNAVSTRFGGAMTLKWALLPSNPPFNGGVLLEIETFYFVISGPDLKWGGIRENMAFYKHLHDYLVKHHPEVFNKKK